MDDPLKEPKNGHVNAAMDLDDECDCSTPGSNNNRKGVASEGQQKHPEKSPGRIPAVVFEDLPYEPNFVMDKIENFWAAVGQFLQKHERIWKILGLVVLVVLYNCYFFGAVAFYVQYKVGC